MIYIRFLPKMANLDEEMREIGNQSATWTYASRRKIKTKPLSLVGEG
jgi:hypothetical protein